MNSQHRARAAWSGLATIALLSLASCTSTNPFTPNSDEADTLPPIELASADGCQLDSDCAVGTFCMQNRCVAECTTDNDCNEESTCSERGRCLDSDRLDDADSSTYSERELAADEEPFAQTPSASNITLKQLPFSVVDVPPGVDEVTITIETSEPVPEGTILYRWEIGDGGASSVARRAEGSDRFELVLPVGLASSAQTVPQPDFITVTTSVGSFQLTMRPERSDSGEYAGEAFFSAFGTHGIPLRFGLEIIPSTASLEDADEVYMAWPSSASDLFSLHGVPSTDETQWERRALSRDPATGYWFARFASGFSFPEGSSFADHPTPQRALRVELWELKDGVIRGAIADRWAGLFSSVNADGIASAGQFVLSGEFEVLRARSLRDEPRTAPLNPGVIAEVPVPPAHPVQWCDPTTFEDLVALAGPPCAAVSNLSTFHTIAPITRIECANAIADVALSGATTAQTILDFMDEDTPNPDNLSFAQFLELCATQDGYCVPTPEVECATQLVSNAYRRFTFTGGVNNTHAVEAVNTALHAFHELSRETYLGSQLAAYHVDTNTRLEWLRASIAPAFLASELRALNETMLARWEAQVLDAHTEAIALQLSPWALDVLSRTPQDPAAAESRELLLLDNIQSWQGTMEALQLAARRWHEVYFVDSARERAANRVKRQTFDLYVAAGLLAHLNQTSELAQTMSSFGSGFAALERALHELSLPYSELLFVRDAEVVLPRSADPSQDQSNLLADRALLAQTAIRDAQTSVDLVLQEAQMTELSGEVLTNGARTQRDELRSELIQLCGVPVGCDASEVGVVVGCDVRTSEGECGFLTQSMSVDPAHIEASQFNVSEAGTALLKVLSAASNIRARASELKARRDQLAILLNETNAFEAHLLRMDDLRRTNNATIDSYAQEMQAQRLGKLEQVAQTYAQMADAREDAFDRQREEIENWHTFLVEDAAGDFDTMLDINNTYAEAERLGHGADLMTGLLEAATELIGDEGPTGWTGLKAGILTAGSFANFGMQMGVANNNKSAGRLEALMDYNDGLENAEIGRLQSLAELNSRVSDSYLAERTEELALLELKTDHEIRTRNAMIDALRRSMEQDIAYENDLQELRERRNRTKTVAFEIPALEEQVLRAQIEAEQAFREYALIAQRAGLIEGRFSMLSARLQNIENILGSPASIFSFANRIARAESRVERAKTALYDWLVALEYYAVRPFMDQRSAILLARNPSELEAIANELQRLQRVCGGPVNYESLNVSVRDHLLGLSRANTVDGADITLSPGERFRAVLRRKNISVNARSRYSSNENVADALRKRDAMGVEFRIRLSDFANLAQTCNTKILSFGIQLVGDGLDENRFPTVSLVHDGEAELISCQPDIQTLVRAVEPGSTRFDLVTRFRTTGRSVSPVARVNSFGDTSVHNRGLEGLPLSSTYALLIDPNIGDNRYIDWSLVDDIRLQITYAYQDVFPAGQCQ